MANCAKRKVSGNENITVKYQNSTNKQRKFIGQLFLVAALQFLELLHGIGTIY